MHGCARLWDKSYTNSFWFLILEFKSGWLFFLGICSIFPSAYIQVPCKPQDHQILVVIFLNVLDYECRKIRFFFMLNNIPHCLFSMRIPSWQDKPKRSQGKSHILQRREKSRKKKALFCKGKNAKGWHLRSWNGFLFRYRLLRRCAHLFIYRRRTITSLVRIFMSPSFLNIWGWKRNDFFSSERSFS